MKIFNESDKKPPGYTESYEVKYWITNKNTGYYEQKTTLYYTMSKNAHKQVSNQFKKDFPGAEMIGITYQ